MAKPTEIAQVTPSSVATATRPEVDQLVVSCCKQLLEQNDDFWLVGALGDWSFEEGSRSSSFRNYVQTLRVQGFSERLTTCLDKGVNGNLAGCICQHPNVDASSVSQHQSRGSDIRFRTKDGVRVEVEVKAVGDGTFAKSYPVVANDLLKLAGRPDKTTFAYAVVFFIQLPHFDYPSGCWYSSAKRYPGRTCVKKGIDTQFEYLMNFTKERPWWRDGEVHKHALSFALAGVEERTLRDRYSAVFRSDRPWSFEAVTHLRDAQVGCAIWLR
jgi:hypothetical protein